MSWTYSYIAHFPLARGYSAERAQRLLDTYRGEIQFVIRVRVMLLEVPLVLRPNPVYRASGPIDREGRMIMVLSPLSQPLGGPPGPRSMWRAVDLTCLLRHLDHFVLMLYLQVPEPKRPAPGVASRCRLVPRRK